MIKININKSKLGNIEYGLKTEQELKELYIGKKIIDVRYNYFAECFEFVLDNGEKLYNE